MSLPPSKHNAGKFISQSHRAAPKQEARVAREIGGRITPGSGNGRQKGDVRVKGALRIECKTTKNQSFSVTQAMIEKIENAATGEEVPTIQIDFINSQGVVVKSMNLIRSEDFNALIVRQLYS